MPNYSARYPWIKKAMLDVERETFLTYLENYLLKKKQVSQKRVVAFPEHMRKNPITIYSFELNSQNAAGKPDILDSILFSEN